MPRIRSIKPEFFKDEKIDELSDTLKILWIGIWCLCDREGRMEDRPKFIKSEVFPYKTINLDTALTQLHDAGYIMRYEVDGKRYIQSKNFLKYQRPYHKEPPSEIPLPVIAASPSGHDREKNAGLGNGLGNGPMEEGKTLSGLTELARKWNELCSELPQVVQISSNRLKKEKTRLKNMGVEKVLSALLKVSQSRFCNGGGNRGWKATYDWFISSDDVIIELLEGKFDDRVEKLKVVGIVNLENPHERT